MTNEEISETCRAFGLEVREIRRGAGLLQLVPAGDHSGAPWAGLAEALKSRDASVRWVTLVIEEADG